MTKKRELTLRDYEQAYEAWLVALLEELGGTKSAVFQAVKKRAVNLVGGKSTNLPNEVARFTATHVNNWYSKSRHSTPADYMKIITQSLIQTVAEELEGKDLAIQVDIETTIAELRRLRGRNQKSGKSLENANLILLKTEAVLAPVANIENLETSNLRLGSWLTSGELPTYVEREVDSQIVERINLQPQNLILISGEHKSGKTRTLFEALSRSNLSHANIYWLRPTSGAIDLAIKELSERNRKNSIVVLDDIQKFSFDIYKGLTLANLYKLLDRATVIGTVDKWTLETWNSLQFDSNNENQLDGPSNQILGHFNSSEINLPTSLSKKELILAEAEFQGQSQTQELINLASYLASIDQLAVVAGSLRYSTSLGSAAISAVIDANILYPAGFSEKVLISLVKANLKKINPKQVWTSSAWENALIKLTTGVNPSSPHSILVPSPSDEDLMVLLDALWTEIKPNSWSTAHLTFADNDEIFSAAKNALSKGFQDESFKLLDQLMDKDFPDAYVFKSILVSQKGNLEDAISLCEKAVQLGANYALSNIGLYQQALGLFEDAKKTFQDAISKGIDESLIPLATIMGEQGDRTSETTLLKRAASKGIYMAENNLGSMALDRHDYVAAERHLKIAAEKGVVLAFSNLGIVFQAAGDFDQAFYWYKKADDNGVKVASKNLGYLFLASGNSGLAQYWFEKASRFDIVVAMRELGAILSSSNSRQSKSWLNKAISHGDLHSMFYIGQLLNSEEKYLESIAILQDLKLKVVEKDIGINYIFDNFGVTYSKFDTLEARSCLSILATFLLIQNHQALGHTKQINFYESLLKSELKNSNFNNFESWFKNANTVPTLLDRVNPRNLFSKDISSSNSVFLPNDQIRSPKTGSQKQLRIPKVSAQEILKKSRA